LAPFRWAPDQYQPESARPNCFSCSGQVRPSIGLVSHHLFQSVVLHGMISMMVHIIVAQAIVRTHGVRTIGADESRYRRYDWDPRSPDRPSAVRQLNPDETDRDCPSVSGQFRVRKFPDVHNRENTSTGPRNCP
jgi:hypothetical protein